MILDQRLLYGEGAIEVALGADAPRSRETLWMSPGTPFADRFAHSRSWRIGKQAIQLKSLPAINMGSVGLDDPKTNG